MSKAWLFFNKRWCVYQWHSLYTRPLYPFFNNVAHEDIIIFFALLFAAATTTCADNSKLTKLLLPQNKKTGLLLLMLQSNNNLYTSIWKSRARSCNMCFPLRHVELELFFSHQQQQEHHHLLFFHCHPHQPFFLLEKTLPRRACKSLIANMVRHQHFLFTARRKKSGTGTDIPVYVVVTPPSNTLTQPRQAFALAGCWYSDACR